MDNGVEDRGRGYLQLLVRHFDFKLVQNISNTFTLVIWNVFHPQL